MAILTKPREDELEALVGRYDLGALRSATGIEAGTVNTSMRLELGSGRHFLRIYEEQGFDGASAEAALLLHLAAAGVPTPGPLRARDGAMVHVVAGKPAALFPWVEGEILCQARVDAAAAWEVGVALARIHRAGAPAEIGEGRFGPADLVIRCDRVARSSDPEARAMAAPLREAVEGVAARRARDLPSGLVHGDLFRDNVLWDEGRIAALLDFESAHRGPFAYDIAVTILSWSYRDALDAAVARAIVDGYRTARELEPAEREGLFDELVLASLRFTITRITDEAIRVGKRWQRFVARREAVERLGRRGVVEMLGL
ncbi:MAG: homoserine kinase [Labilithrix sp.]|nr:homoserine kinase [Labilithrix sp.]